MQRRGRGIDSSWFGLASKGLHRRLAFRGLRHGEVGEPRRAMIKGKGEGSAEESCRTCWENWSDGMKLRVVVEGRLILRKAYQFGFVRDNAFGGLILYSYSMEREGLPVVVLVLRMRRLSLGT